MDHPTYQRLTRVRNRAFFSLVTRSRTSLWLGPDHLLCVDSTGFTESYKRFYFRDIQVITVQATNRRAVWNWILGLLAALCLIAGDLGSLFRNDPSPQVFVFGILFFVFAVPLVLNNVFGRTCLCQLRTAVQTEDLASLSRIRKTRKVLDKIRPLIAAAQGELTPEEISQRLRDERPVTPENIMPERVAPESTATETSPPPDAAA